MTENEITSKIISAAIIVHEALGPGMLENTYKQCLAFKLTQMGLHCQVEKGLPVIFESVKLECGYRCDLLVNNMVIVEIKCAEAIHKKHIAQVLHYLKLSRCKVGLVINFNEYKLTEGIRRVVNGF